MEKYPLEQVFFIKKKKLTDAEKVLREKKELLAKEIEKLEAAQKEYLDARKHRDDKLKQLRDALDAGQGAAKIQPMKTYFKIVDEKSQQKEQKLRDQKKQVTQAEAVVEVARSDYIKRQMDVEKLNLHKGEWSKKQDRIEEQKEATHNDEMGTTGFVRKKKSKKKEAS